MSISIASNVASLRAQNQLRQSSEQLSKSFERLSSGLRINTPGDDPAGLAVADKLRTDTMLATVAIRNSNDGLSLVAIADSSLGEIGSILQRMAELAEQSANGVFTNTQRSAMSSEFLSLGSEVDRIARTTNFNNLALLSNSSNVTLQVGLDSSSSSQITVSGVQGTLQTIGLAAAGSSALTFSIISSTSDFSVSSAQNALTAVNSAISSISARRGILGATESRLSYAINNLQVARENYIAAESRIRDVDMAEEVAQMVRLQVLQQAQTAVMAQANQQPKIALALLQ